MVEKEMDQHSWSSVCKPKDQGGLVVLDIAMHNKALLLKQLHKFINKHDLPWVHLIWETYYSNNPPTDRSVGSFWWKSIIKLLPSFKELAFCSLGQGNSALFWHDKWTPIAFKNQFPELFSYVMNGLFSVKTASETEHFEDLFHRPLPVQAFAQYQQAKMTLEHTALTTDSNKWSYVWNSANFIPSKAYNYLIRGEMDHPVFKKIWSSSVMLRYKIFSGY